MSTGDRDSSPACALVVRGLLWSGACRSVWMLPLLLFCAGIDFLRSVTAQGCQDSEHVLFFDNRAQSRECRSARLSLQPQLVVFSVLVLFVSCDVSLVTSFSFASLLFLLFAGSTRVGSGSRRLFGKSGTTRYVIPKKI